MIQTYPDTEGAVKAALKAALPQVAGRVFYKVPKGTPSLPLVTLALISGGPDDGEAPIDEPRLTFDCWAVSKEEASDVKRALVSWMRSLSGTMLDDHTFCYYVSGINVTWLPDNDAQLARYVVDATFTVASRP